VIESEQKYKITIKPFSNGKLIHAYESNPEFGYVVLESQEPYIDFHNFHNLEGFLKNKADISKLPKRETILRGKVETLKKIIATCENTEIPGRIRVIEFRENEIPNNVEGLNLRKDIPYEDAISSFIKKHHYKTSFRLKKNDASIVLKSQGQRILHFKEWSIAGEEDILIKKYDDDVEEQLKLLFIKALEPPKITSIEELEKKEIFGSKITETKKEEFISGQKSLKNDNLRIQESVKRENRIAIPIFLTLLVGSIVLMVIIPSIFTFLAVIFGSLVIFYFAGGFYEAIFSKNAEFNLLRTILVGVVVIIIIGIIIFISELTKTSNDPDMWRHP
jgi:hypothetical protein